MKQLKIISITFALAFLLSLLLDIDFVAKNYIRHALVIIMILFVLYFGYHLLKVESNKK
jgi:hypothetical protein